jgi:hypothetical protein
VMHDLLRELAIHQSKGEPFEQRKRLIIDLNGDDRPDWWIGPNQQGIISRMYSFIAGMLIKQKQLKVAARILSISTGMFLFSEVTNNLKRKRQLICYIGCNMQYSFTLSYIIF